jgi:hypothetical protein
MTPYEHLKQAEALLGAADVAVSEIERLGATPEALKLLTIMVATAQAHAQVATAMRTQVIDHRRPIQP